MTGDRRPPSAAADLAWALRLGRSGRGRLALAALLGALASAAAVGLTATSAWLITRASQQPPVLYLMVAIVAVRTFGIARGALRYGERLAGHDATFRTLGDLRVATVRRLERVLPLRGTETDDRLSSGELLARFVDDVDGLQDLWVRVVLPAAGAAAVGAGTVALVVALDPTAGLILAASLLLAAIVAPLLSTRAASGAAARLTPLRARYRDEVLDLLEGSTELAVYGALPDRLERLDRLDEEMVRAGGRSAIAAGAGAAVATLAAGAAVWAALWFGTGAVRAGTLAAVGLAVVVLVPLAVHEVVGALAPAAHQLPRLAASAARVRAVLEQPDAVTEPARPAALPAGPYGLRLRGVRARWHDGGAEVLRGVDLDVAPGSTTLIVGPSGSGKSTIAAVLLRMLDPSGGRIELVGSDGTAALADLAADDVRSVIGWCAQDAYVFDSTIEANLRLARPDATAEQLDDALERAGLAAWVGSLPGGLATMVGEHGAALSGGQRQRLALARVLLADRPVVVFDEPTEHLDEPAAAALAADLLRTGRDRTVLIVSHRPELFRGVDDVVALHEGHLVRIDADAA